MNPSDMLYSLNDAIAEWCADSGVLADVADDDVDDLLDAATHAAFAALRVRP